MDIKHVMRKGNPSSFIAEGNNSLGMKAAGRTMDAMRSEQDREASGGHEWNLIMDWPGIIRIHGRSSGGSIREESSQTHDGSSWRMLDCQRCRAGKVCRWDAELCRMRERELADPC
jgi:hypothetical protein